MKVLIDNVLETVEYGYVVRNKPHAGARISWHGTSLNAKESLKENTRLISSGHYYVINYNEATFEKRKYEPTFENYLMCGIDLKRKKIKTSKKQQV